MHDNADAPFYVGYLPVPKRIARFLWLVVIANIAFFIISATLLARSMTDPGPAVWNDGKPQRYIGTLVLWPYPILITDGVPRLMVEVGKHGVARELGTLQGKLVAASGWTLDRGGERMLELEPDAASIVPADSGTSMSEAALTPETLGIKTLRGEIVDSKCFLGAMKPGDQKTHKACATLCVRGGIPPVLVERLKDGVVRCTLLVGPDGGPLEAAAFDRIAEPVEVTGSLETLAGLRRLRVAADAIRRLQ